MLCVDSFMPQFDTNLFFSSLTWLFIFFLFFYLHLVFFFLPKLFKVFFLRRLMTQFYLAKTVKLKIKVKNNLKKLNYLFNQFNDLY